MVSSPTDGRAGASGFGYRKQPKRSTEASRGHTSDAQKIEKLGLGSVVADAQDSSKDHRLFTTRHSVMVRGYPSF